MNISFIKKKRFPLLILFVSLSLISISACAKKDVANTTTNESPSVTNAPSTTVIESIGYLLSIDSANQTMLFDDAEVVTSNDTKKIKELNLTEEDLYPGYTIYNKDEIAEELHYDSSILINIYDTMDISKMNSITIDEFQDLLKDHSLFCKLSIIDGTIYNITEEYLP